MCGITGFWRHASEEKDMLESQVSQMTKALEHRGPDDQGVWVDGHTGLALGMRRLAVLDLSPSGHQPMISACSRYILVYNGEIYNFNDIRQRLQDEGCHLRSHTDTEAILEGCARWGVPDVLKHCNGMFAFALWDKDNHMLTLARDRLGVKPLYYGWSGKNFVFGSELKAICAYDGFAKEVNRGSLALFLRHNYIPSPHSIYNNIYKLPPGTILVVKNPELGVTPTPYWSAENLVEHGQANRLPNNTTQAIQDVTTLLQDAVRLRMIADVPVGAFLSGGIDSSLIVALMQSQASHAVKTFTIGFSEAAYNEAHYAKEVASYLGTEHTELYVSPEETMSVIPRLPEIYDEPFADSSQIPTFLVSQLTRSRVTVALSGDGGDEIFGGYQRYLLGTAAWKWLARCPMSLRSFGKNLLYALSPQGWDKICYPLCFLLPGFRKFNSLGDKLHKLANVLTDTSPQRMYLELQSHTMTPGQFVIGGTEPPVLFTDAASWTRTKDFTESMMYVDLVTYLPDDILTKVDRASMAVALECRQPFLDSRVVALAWQLPLAMKIKANVGKWILRQILYRYVPPQLVERPKMGFAIPLAVWLRGPLRSWAEELLSEKGLRSESFFNPAPIRQKWLEFLQGQQRWQYLLWNVLTFQAWQKRWL